MKSKVNVYIVKDGNWFVAKCLENNVASQGKTIDESLENLREAIALYYESETFIAPPETLLVSMEVTV